MSESSDPFQQAEQLLFDAGVIEVSPADRVKIKLVPVMSKLAEQVGLVLGKAPHKLFLRGDAVMKIEFDPNQDDYDFAPMLESEFVTWSEKYVSFGREVKIKDEDGEDTGKQRWSETSINPKVAKLILMSPQFRACLPRVARKNRVPLPTLRKPTPEHPRGKIELLKPGFDEASGMFTFPSPVVIDETWTPTQAVRYLVALYSGFPIPVVSIGDEEKKAIRLCPRTLAACATSMMATFVDGLIPAKTLRCGFFFTANMQGSGKSLLGKMATAPFHGRTAVLTVSRNDDTLRSSVDAALLSGQSSLFFDNVKGHLDNQVIEALMTATFWTGRMMHTQRFFTVKNETTIYISGNNATVSSDLNRRFVWVNLQSETLDISERQHAVEIDDGWLVEAKNRSDILSALWALVRNWDALGRPAGETSVASFKSWCDVVGGVMCAAARVSDDAWANPLVQPEMENAGDKETRHLKRLVQLLVDDARKTIGFKGGNMEFEPVELMTIVMENGLFDWFMPELAEGKEVNDVLKQPERVRLGKLLTARSGEHPRGMKYVVKEGDQAHLWRFSYRGSGKGRRYLLDRE